MGIFNLFIVIPQVVATLALGPAMQFFLKDDPVQAVAAGGVCLAIAALLTVVIVTYRNPKTLVIASSSGAH